MRPYASCTALALIISGVLPLSALEIADLHPGELEHAIGEAYDVTALTISGGAISADDFGFIIDKLHALEYLDLRGCQCVALPDCALLGLQNLKEVQLPEGLTAIGMGAFSGSGITYISIPESVDSISDYAFRGCTQLQTVDICGVPHYFGRDAFLNCKSMQSINFDVNSSLQLIPPGFVEGCEKLQELNLLSFSECETIGTFAMAHCPSISQVILPESINYISDGAMAFMTGLTTIDARNLSNVPDTQKNIWAGVNAPDVTLIVRDDMTDRFMLANQWQEFKILSNTAYETLTSDNTVEKSSNSMRIIIDGRAVKIIIDSGQLGCVKVYTMTGIKVMEVTSDTSETEFSLGEKQIYLIVTDNGVAKIKI